MVEDIKSRVSEKLWINQQVWTKKQESYEAIFEMLYHVKRYVTHQVSEFEEWQYYDSFPGYCSGRTDEDSYSEWEKEKEEYENKKSDPNTEEQAEKLKLKYESSMLSLFRLIEIKSIYLDDSVGSLISNLKRELSTSHNYEGWDDHFDRLEKQTSCTIDQIKEISMRELQIAA